MSNTQQEIATPQDCKQCISPLIPGVCALIFVSFLALAFVGLGIWLATNNSVIAVSIVIALSVALAGFSSFAVRKIKPLLKIVLNVVTAEVAFVLILWFLSTLNDENMASNIIFIATTAVMAVVLICLNIVKTVDKPTRITTKYLTYAATFVALSVLFKMLGNAVSSIVIIPNMRLSFVYIPWVLSGIVLGPVGGVITALVSDLLGQLTIAVGGAINPLTMLSNALFPLASALIYRFVKRGPNWLKLLGGMAISLVVCTMGIGAAALYWQYEYYHSMSFIAYTLAFRWPQIIIIAINYFLCLLLLPVVNKMKLTYRLKNASA